MGKLRDIHKKLKQRIRTQEEELGRIIMKHEQALLDLNREQMMRGERADGTKLPEYKNPDYAAMKELYNPEGVMDLRLSGSFHNLMYLEVRGKFVVIWSNDGKTGTLIDTYGNVFGFTEASKKLIPKILEKDLEEFYRKFIQL